MTGRANKISDLLGEVLHAESSGREVAIVPLYHPAVALYNAGQKDTLKQDFQKLKQFI